MVVLLPTTLCPLRTFCLMGNLPWSDIVISLLIKAMCESYAFTWICYIVRI